jgi:toxin CptA
VALCVLALAAVAALWLSDMPRIACGIGSALVLAYAGWLLHREASRPACVLSWPGGDTPWQVECDGCNESLRHVGASFRGGLVALTLAEETGRTRRYVWWPDTMDARGRRALRLAMRVKETITPVQSTLAQ